MSSGRCFLDDMLLQALVSTTNEIALCRQSARYPLLLGIIICSNFQLTNNRPSFLLL